MAYWECVDCGAENHDAYHLCTRCGRLREEPVAGEKSLRSDESESPPPAAELTSKHKWQIWLGVWAVFLVVPVLGMRESAPLVIVAPWLLVAYPGGLVMLLWRDCPAPGQVVLLAWAGYAALTMVAMSARSKRGFKRCLAVLVGALVLNTVGCLLAQRGIIGFSR